MFLSKAICFTTLSAVVLGQSPSCTDDVVGLWQHEASVWPLFRRAKSAAEVLNVGGSNNQPAKPSELTKNSYSEDQKDIVREEYQKTVDLHGAALDENLVMNRLAAKASKYRNAAERDSFPNPEEALMGNQSLAKLEDIFKSFTVDAAVSDRLVQARVALQRSVAKYVLRAKEIVESFTQGSANATSQEFVPLVLKLLNESSELFLEHQNEDKETRKVIDTWMPDKRLAEMFTIVSQSPIRFSPPDKLASINANAPCLQLTAKISEVMPQYSNVSRSKRLLNATALAAHNVIHKWYVKTFVRDVVEMGYYELLAFEDISVDFLTKAGPVLARRLNCTWSSAVHSAMPSGLFAYVCALVLVAATAFKW